MRWRFRRRWAPVLVSLLVAGPWVPPVQAAEQLDVRLDGLQIPLDLGQLEAWAQDEAHPQGDLAVWVDLLDPARRNDLLKLLRAPLVRDRSLVRQLLQSWAGQRVLDAMGELIGSDQGKGGRLLITALHQLLETPGEITTIALLRAVPAREVSVDLDGLLALADRWRLQLRQQRQGLLALRALALAPRGALLPFTDGVALERRGPPSPVLESEAPLRRRLQLPVVHRPVPLELQLWQPGSAADRSGGHRPWVLLMHGLGGSTDQLDWLANSLAERGWSVLAVDHPGSDEQAVRELLRGRRPPPGAEALPARLGDLQEVLRAEHDGRLPPLGDSVVLMGHSLGGVAALLATGIRPDPGLDHRCERALRDLPLINLSRLLQCQLVHVALPPPAPLAEPLAGVVSFNGFGSLLWSREALAKVPVPVLLVGGSLDLITPPLSEQLALFLPSGHPSSRLVLVEGGSHFSPVRIPQGAPALFQLGQQLVGVDPGRVQALLLSLSSDFLQSLAQGRALPSQERRLAGVRAYVLDAPAAQRWRQLIRN